MGDFKRFDYIDLTILIYPTPVKIGILFMHSWRNNSIIVSADRTLKVVAYGVVKHIQAKLFKPEFTKLPAKQNENIQTDKLDNCSMQQHLKSNLHSQAISWFFPLFRGI